GRRLRGRGEGGGRGGGGGGGGAGPARALPRRRAAGRPGTTRPEASWISLQGSRRLGRRQAPGPSPYEGGAGRGWVPVPGSAGASVGPAGAGPTSETAGAVCVAGQAGGRPGRRPAAP